MPQMTTVGKYLVSRLEDMGLKHIFGIPGDYVLDLYDLLVDSSIEVVGTTCEAGAGFAADAYARVNGLGAVCLTYTVGGFNVLNAVAGAYAEKSPLVVISGSPGLKERTMTPLLHHRVRGFDTQFRIFEMVTACAEELNDPMAAPRRIDRAIAHCLGQKRPVYIELPRDMVDAPCRELQPLPLEECSSRPDVLEEALAEAAAMLRKAKRPVILAGVEIHRFGLQDKLLDLMERSGHPVAATLLGKSIIRENHSQYLGVYEGVMGRTAIRRAVEQADCLLILGAFMTDVNLGIYTARLDVARTINANSERVAVKRHVYEGILLKEFIEGLTKRLPARKGKKKVAPEAEAEKKPFKPRSGKPITVKRFFARMNEFLDNDVVVIADVGDSLFGAVDLSVHRRTEFISPAYYTSMGFAVPAALGAQINQPDLRPVVFVGDGAFQMTGQELSTIARHNLNPIVFVLNNKGYTTERMISDGPYNDIHEWAYHLWPEIVRRGWGCEVRTEGELEKALIKARVYTGSFSIVNVHLDKWDHSHALERLGKRIGKQAKPPRKKGNSS